MRSTAKTTGLRYWMLRVLDECEKVSTDFDADPVHDLRVALRRCRSMADGMVAIDPDRNWKAMKKGGKQLFQRLGELRDVQIMMEWIEELHLTAVPGARPNGNQATSVDTAPVAQSASVVTAEILNPAQALLRLLQTREAEEKHEARAALAHFDRKQWREWSDSLPQRAARIRRGSPAFKHLALERWTVARELHIAALRSQSEVALHTLRIAIKRFRYIVENFLPAEHKAWADDLKRVQDLLGDVHDLDVLWATAQSCHIFHDEVSRDTWRERILAERTKRVDEYRDRTVGAGSLWDVWRAGLPQGKQIPEIATQRMKLWAKALDPDFAHSERVARLSLQLYDQLKARQFDVAPQESDSKARDPRSSLHAAALLHDVGKSAGKKDHHKHSEELIKAHGTPLGWNDEDMRRAAVVARFHCGALPVRSHKGIREMPSHEQKVIIWLSAILRLANALDCAHDGHIRRIKVEDTHLSKNGSQSNGSSRRAAIPRNEAVVVAAEGYAERTKTAQTVAAERYLLETVLRRPVIVRPMKNASS
jgi:CHAD domain-containing protein